jgi:hypothetical protein
MSCRFTAEMLMWPCSFLVVSVVRRSIAGRKLWVHVPGTNMFEEATLTIL